MFNNRSDYAHDCFQRGRICEEQKNYAKARQEYSRAACHGNVDARNALAQMYASGKGVKKNYPIALYLYCTIQNGTVEFSDKFNTLYDEYKILNKQYVQNNYSTNISIKNHMQNFGIDSCPFFYNAFSFFNKTLFSGKLPNIIITFKPDRFRCIGKFEYSYDYGNSVININSKHISQNNDVDSLKVLVHEMVHFWQMLYGKPRSIHGKEFADKMLDIGILTFGEQQRDLYLLRYGDALRWSGSTTLPDDLIIEDGPFAKACTDFIKKFDQHNLGKSSMPEAVQHDRRFLCPNCGKTHDIILRST